MELLPAAVYAVDHEGLLTFYNDAAATLWGRRAQIGQDRWTGAQRLLRTDGSDLAADESPLALALAQQKPLLRQRLTMERPDGSRVFLLADASPLHDSSGLVTGGVCMLAVTSDATDVERLLSRYAAIVEGSDDAIISKNLEGIITSWNPAAERIFGYRAEEAIGRSVMMLIPPDRADEEAEIIARIQRKERIGHFDTIRIHKSGRPVPVSLTISPILSKSGQIIGASKIARNISERKETEQRIQALMREVNHRVKNQFAVILSMVRETGKHAHTPAQFESRFRERIMALSRSQDLLVSGDWRGAMLSELVESQVEPFADLGNVSLSGPDLHLQHNAVQYLGMAFHELATNSFRHGALSHEEGRVNVTWTVDEERRFHLSWAESDAPDGRHRHAEEDVFGRIVLERVTPAALSGTATFTHEPAGPLWELEAPTQFVTRETADGGEQPSQPPGRGAR